MFSHTSSPGASFSQLGTGTYRSRSPSKRDMDTTVFGYESPPDVPAVHRDVYKWIQGLDLSHALKNVRRDVANGFLVAEVFSRYFPADIQMHSFANATSTYYKRDNWTQLQRFCAKQGIDLPSDLVEGSLRGVHGAASALLEHLYEVFTGKTVPRISPTQGGAGTLSAAGAASLLANSGSPAAGGAGGMPGAQQISSKAKDSQAIEFGAVRTQSVGDAMALRKRLAAGGV